MISTHRFYVLENLRDCSPWGILHSSGLAGSNVSEDFFYEEHRTTAVTVFHILYAFYPSQVADG